MSMRVSVCIRKQTNRLQLYLTIETIEKVLKFSIVEQDKV